MIKCGWKNADNKMRMIKWDVEKRIEKCGLQNADDKMLRIIKSGQEENTLRYFR